MMMTTTSSGTGSAAAAVQLTARQARSDFAADLQHCHDQARDAARDRARRLISTARPSAQSAHSRYDAAARVLREWYLSVHDAALGHSLGATGHAPGVAAVEATAAQVGRIRTGEDPQGPLRATVLVWQVASTDADAATVATLKRLRADVAHRARAFVGDQDEGDELSSAILRHWYQRCYLEAADARLGLLQPLQAVTRGEAREVAASIEARQARRIIGADGVPLVTAHGTQMTETDRRLAAGETGVVPPPSRPTPPAPPNRVLRERVVRAWTRSQATTRSAWANAAGVPQASDLMRWADVPGEAQSRLIAQWLDDHRDRFARPPAAAQPAPVYPLFNGPRHRLRGPAEEAAARMFGHAPHPAR